MQRQCSLATSPACLCTLLSVISCCDLLPCSTLTFAASLTHVCCALLCRPCLACLPQVLRSSTNWTDLISLCCNSHITAQCSHQALAHTAGSLAPETFRFSCAVSLPYKPGTASFRLECHSRKEE